MFVRLVQSKFYAKISLYIALDNTPIKQVIHMLKMYRKLKNSKNQNSQNKCSNKFEFLQSSNINVIFRKKFWSSLPCYKQCLFFCLPRKFRKRYTLTRILIANVPQEIQSSFQKVSKFLILKLDQKQEQTHFPRLNFWHIYRCWNIFSKHFFTSGPQVQGLNHK